MCEYLAHGGIVGAKSESRADISARRRDRTFGNRSHTHPITD